MTKQIMSEQQQADGATVFYEVQQLLKTAFQDNFIIRYVDGSVKIMSESEAVDEWNVRQNDNYWLTVSTVQLTPGNKFSIGDSISFCFQVFGFDKAPNEK